MTDITGLDPRTLFHIAKNDPRRMLRIAEAEAYAVDAARDADRREEQRAKGGRPQGQRRAIINRGKR